MPTNVLNATVLTASGQPVQFTQGGPQKLIVTQHAGGQPRLIVPAQQVALLSNGTVSTTHGAAPGGATIGQYDYLLAITKGSYKKRINYFSLFQKHVFIIKMGFRMSFHFQNEVLFRNMLLFSKCERFCECCFSFF